MPTADPLRSRALACLREGRVTVLAVGVDKQWQPIRVLARVRSSRDDHLYRIRRIAGTWSCTCREGLREQPCPHVRAVAMVTTGDGA